MKNAMILTLLTLFSVHLWAAEDVIYGYDDRKDYFEVSNHLHRKLADSTAGMIHIGLIKYSQDMNALGLSQTGTLEQLMNVCPSEKFSQQKTAPNCSGFLVGEDTLITAGHCYKSYSSPEEVCKSFAWVFDYHLKSPNHDPTLNIPKENIYLCSKVIRAEFNQTMDYAIIKLHKKVTGRNPLKFRTSGKVSDSAHLLVIGHPSGLPQKISAGGRVTMNSWPMTFQTTLDTFQGNSGSAVFDANTGLVEGILIQGKTDYVPSIKDDPSSCLVVNRCNDDARGCIQDNPGTSVMWGEVVFRITNISNGINSALGTQSNPVTDVSPVVGDRLFTPASKL